MSSSRRRITRIGGGQPKPSSMTLRRPGDEQDQQSEIGKDDPLPSPASQDPTPGQGRASGSSSTPRRRKLTIPNCAVCDTPPKEPHGVYCCGAMYCHTCFVRAMSEAAIAGRQAACASCGKPMGDPPKKRRLLTPAAQATLAPASVLPGPPIPGWSFATAAEINSNPFRHMSKPEDWIPSTRAEPSGIQHPSLPSSGPNSMSSMYHSFDNYPMRGHELMHLQATNPSKGSDLPLPNIYRPGGRMTEASGRNAQNQRIMAVIGDVDEMLPKLPDIFAAEEARRIEQQKEAELKVKQELPRPQVVKGPGCATCCEFSVSFLIDLSTFPGMLLYFVTHNNPPYRPTASPVGFRLQVERGARPTLREPARPNDPYRFFYDLIRRCCVLDPSPEISTRPSFAEIVAELTSLKNLFGVERVL